MKLKDKVALITGGSDGIGQAVAADFAREGADVAVTYLSSEAGARETCAMVEAAGKRAAMFQVDVRHKAQIDAMVKSVYDKFGKIDILVNNAGLTKGADIFDLSEDLWDQIIDVNLKGTYLVTQPIARKMKEQESGVIINMSSIAGMVGETAPPVVIHYGAAKQGIVAMTRALARTLAPNVRVNAVAPGVILTDFHVKAGGNAEGVQKRIQDVPLLRGGTAQEVATVTTFLACDDSSYITGQTIVVDGGLGMP